MLTKIFLRVRALSVGNLVVCLGVAMGAGLAQGSTGTSEPTFGEDQLLCLGRIVVQVPVS